MTRRDFLALAAAACAIPFAPWLAADRFAELTTGLDRTLPVGEIMAEVARRLLETPYVGMTLDQDIHQEQCVINLAGLDCVTFFEITLGIARMVRQGTVSPEALKKQVTLTRYRGGKLDGYASRLHYTSDWMRDNVAKKVVQDLTRTLPGSVPLQKKINFMTANAVKYPQIKEHPELIEPLRAIEARLNASKPFHVPINRAFEAERTLRTGDIIGITTTLEGMDCGHTGLIIVEDDVPHFVHASSTLKKVVIGPKLSEYLKSYPKNTGFMAVRPL